MSSLLFYNIENSKKNKEAEQLPYQAVMQPLKPVMLSIVQL
jgi:hypothetical protein